MAKRHRVGKAKRLACRTYTTRQTSRSNELFGASDLVYTDVICEDGTVTTTVKGTSDGEYVNQSKAHKFDRITDWDKLHRARVAMGWRQTS